MVISSILRNDLCLESSPINFLKLFTMAIFTSLLLSSTKFFISKGINSSTIYLSSMANAITSTVSMDCFLDWSYLDCSSYTRSSKGLRIIFYAIKDYCCGTDCCDLSIWIIKSYKQKKFTFITSTKDRFLNIHTKKWKTRSNNRTRNQNSKRHLKPSFPKA